MKNEPEGGPQLRPHRQAVLLPQLGGLLLSGQETSHWNKGSSGRTGHKCGDTLIVWKLVSVVLGLQAELARFGSDHGRAGNRPGTYDDPAVGSSLHPGVPKALEPLRTYGRRVLANGRDLDQGAWPVEVLPSRGEEENVQAMR